ncbi:acyl-CoA dehydrogenase family protein [Mycolicibacterium flavescens]|uniref:Hydroxylase n=1 Tax=Mycolicibacterium flavescens TaxID=1776 RepID=A0A1E3RNM4_MYCFV|nr:acyl-CoA dehydrogenase family protein [Mycolicibacterium flavescens]MCV7278223.1 acyl-CoA dehydrogenase family protein [Mycolicibacterium flavescens]ODQ91485.1 hydroxylase [Mycolicibacterium flavescens]
MSYPHATVAPAHAPQHLYATAKRIADTAAGLAADIDAHRRLPDKVLTELAVAKLLRAGAPVETDGLELDPVTLLRCAETVARGNASAGWCVSIAATSSLMQAYLPERSGMTYFGNGVGVAAGVWAPRGRARRVPGGVKVTGRWQFCSGISHSDMFFGGCVIGDSAEHSVVAIPVADLNVLDTWHTLGLRGTGSHDAVADEVFVPDDRVLSLADGPRIDRALYRFPIFGYFASSIAAAALGNARAAVDNFVDLAADKKSGGSARTLAERQSVQGTVAAAEAALRAARALYYHAIEKSWNASRVDTLTTDDRLQLRLAASHAVRTSADVVRTVYDLAGGSAVYDDAPLQRNLRDAFTASAHFQVSSSSFELSGRLLVRQPTNVVTL